MILKDLITSDLKTKLRDRKIIVDVHGEDITSTSHRRIEHIVADMFSEGELVFKSDKVLVEDIKNIQDFNDFKAVYEEWFVEETLLEVAE